MTQQFNAHDGPDDVKLNAEEQALEERLRSVRPTALSPGLHAKLQGYVGHSALRPSRWDRAAKLALPWACAACLALGFVVGAQTGPSGGAGGAAVHGVDEGPTSASQLRLTLVDLADDRSAPYRSLVEREATQRTRSNHGEEEVPLLSSPFTSSSS